MWGLFGQVQGLFGQVQGLFGQMLPKDPRELAREWKLVLRKENRQLERQIHAIKYEEEKTKQHLKESCGRGDREACRLLATEIVRTRKAIGRFYTAQAKLASIECHINEQLSIVCVSDALHSSAEVMRAMQELVQVSDVSESMRELSKEMMKAGVIEEMVDEMFIEVEVDVDLEDEVQNEVEKVLWDLTAGELERAPDVVNDPLPGLLSTGPESVAMETEMEAETEEEDRVMKARLEALRS